MAKLYIVRKFIKAESLEEAYLLDKTTKPDDIYLADKSFEKLVTDTINEISDGNKIGLTTT